MSRAFHILLSLGLSALAAQGATTLDGAEFYSNEVVRFGRWEMRMRVAATPGSVSSFFTYYNNSYLGAPEPWREIDIEIIGKDAKGFQSNLITGTAASRTTSEAFHASTADLSQGFHTFVLDWTPDSIVYRIDGQTVRKTPGSDQQVKDLADRDASYRMNLWASTASDWAGQLDPAKLPVAQTVNWIAYSSYTPGQGPKGSDFTPRWTDDFGSLDATRWSRGNWTFDGNLADFTPNNAVVSGGYLMLILSKKGWTGTLTPPSDPEGNTRPVPVRPGTLAEGLRMQARDGFLLIDAGRDPAEFVVATLQGRTLARRTGSGLLSFAHLPRGILLVRAPAGDRLVFMP